MRSVSFLPPSLSLTEVYNGYVEPNNIENDTEFLTHQVLETILRGIDIDQEYAMS